jgi:hypothetical protein
MKIGSVLLITSLLLGIACIPQGSVGADIQGPLELVSVIVQGQSTAELVELITAVDGRVTQELPVIHSIVADLSPEAVEQVRLHPAVSRVWLNHSVTKAGEPDGTVEAPSAGTLLWTTTTDKPVDHAPVGAPNGTLVVADKVNTVYAYDTDGALLHWQ